MRLRSTTTWVLAALLWSVLGAPADAHWADQAVAEIKVLETAAEMVLSFPTGLVAWADNNRSGALDLAEVERHQPALERFLSERVRFTDRGRMGKLMARTSAGAGRAVRSLPPRRLHGQLPGDDRRRGARTERRLHAGAP
ncbi:MAG: hypothetical protein HYY39_05400 [Armatimonadetes bacterium]|nr:hypothetical protein [Armatimonadota bacterium]